MQQYISARPTMHQTLLYIHVGVQDEQDRPCLPGTLHPSVGRLTIGR